MKDRNFELSPLNSREFSNMLMGVSNEMLRHYRILIDDEQSRRDEDKIPDKFKWLKGEDDES